MQRLAWALAPLVFLAIFGVRLLRLGIQPAVMRDNLDYTYPSFTLAERGSFGFPPLGPGLNIEKRAHSRTVFYDSRGHTVLISLFGDGPHSVSLADAVHFARRSAVGTFFLGRRQAALGIGSIP